MENKSPTPTKNLRNRKTSVVLDDNSRKSLDILVKKLCNECHESQKNTSKTNKPETPWSMKKTKSNLTPNKGKRSDKNTTPKSGRHCDSNYPKITKWLSKETLTNSKGGITRPRSKKTLQKSDTLDKSSTNNNLNHKKSKLPRSNSFEKYGVLLPSVEEMLAQHKKYDEHKKTVEAFNKLEDVDLELPSLPNKSNDTSDSELNILDCKDLSSSELKLAFYNNLDYIRDILEGRRYSERHKRFHNYKTTYNNTTRDLTYSTSTIIFNDDQKLQLISLMEKELDPEDKYTKYFFQVLLPELCLKIFMDIHSMTEQEAATYLNKRPVI